MGTKQEVKHTPGDWGASTSPDYWGGSHVVRSKLPSGLVVAVMTKLPDAEDNARLMAASPNMLAALKSIALIGGNLPDDRLTNATGPKDAELRGGMYVSAREIARAAITKATESE